MPIRCRHSEMRRLADADTATHGDPVHECDHRFGIGIKQVIKLIFVMKEAQTRNAVVIQRRVAQESDVAARAKPPTFGMIDDNALHRSVCFPGLQCGRHGVHHIERQRVDGCGAVKADHASMPIDSSEDVVCHRGPYADACRPSR